ncbi:MAG: ABC transporter permease [Verrucomicrobiales bacterium]
MQRILAITLLTMRAAVRYRLVLALSFILLAGVILLPIIIRHDGTARGFTQILLTYTLSFITAILGFATIWLACGTLAREIEESQMQMLVVKPISRWQIWIGKWLGIMGLNAILLLISASAVYGILMYRASKLPEKEQQVLRDEVMIARASAKEETPDYMGDADRIFRERMEAAPPPEGADPNQLRQMVVERVKAEYQIVRSGYMREWQIDLGSPSEVKDQPLYIRAKFNSPDLSTGVTYEGNWEIGTQGTAMLFRTNMVMVPDTFMQFLVPANLYDEKGVINIRFINANQSALLFPLEDGMEVLYAKGGFGMNFVRGTSIILCWLSVLAALGLAASSLLSFPVAAFCAIGVLVVTFSTGTLKQIVTEGGISGVNNNTGLVDDPKLIDLVAVPLARTVLGLLNLARGFSPIDFLSSGRVITWGELTRAFFQIIVVICGVLAAIGISIFNRRELASTQGKL